MAEERSVDDGANAAGGSSPEPGGTRGAHGAEAAPPADAAEQAAVLARVDALRRRIDDLDEQIVALLSARASCALQVGSEKKLMGLEIYQPSREADVLAHVQRVNRGPLNDAAIKRLFERIIDEARRLEREAEVKETEGGAGDAAPHGERE